MQPLGVIVLTGGGSSRMGRHKPALEVGGRPIVERILAACAGLPVVVVGDGAAVPDGTPVVREDPAGGGPVAGIAAGFAALMSRYAAQPGSSDPDLGNADPQDSGLGDPSPGEPGLERIAVVAGDLPFLTRAAIDELVEALDADPSAELALPVDPDQHVNWLCGVWRTSVLAARLDAVGSPSGVSVRRLIDASCRALVEDRSGWSSDVDTPGDLAAARAAAAQPVSARDVPASE